MSQGAGFNIGDVLNVKLKKSGTGGRGNAGSGEKKIPGQPDLPPPPPPPSAEEPPMAYLMKGRPVCNCRVILLKGRWVYNYRVIL